MTTPKIPLSRVKSTTGHVWRQADGTLFSCTEYADWIWERLVRADEADALEARLNEMEDEALEQDLYK